MTPDTHNHNMHIDRILAVLGIATALLLMGGGVVRERPLYIFLGLLLIISCLFWLMKGRTSSLTLPQPADPSKVLLLASAFFFLLGGAVLTLLFRPEMHSRPFEYFILTALMAGIIGVEILYASKQHIPLILTQIILLGFSISFSQFLLTPGTPGVDPWFHQMLTSAIIENQMIPEGFTYSRLPLFHLMIATTSILAGLNYMEAVMISVSLAHILGISLFIFLLGRHLFKSYRIGLLSSLLVILANYHTNLTVWAIPNSFGAIFIPIVLYLAFIRRDEEHVAITSLSLLARIALVITHTIAAVCMAVLLITGWIGDRIAPLLHSDHQRVLPLALPVGFIVVMFAWWTFASDHLLILTHFIEEGFSREALYTIPDEIREYLWSTPLNEQIFGQAGLYLFFSIAIIGILYMVSKRGNSRHFTMALIAITPITLAFLSFMSGHAILENRWWYFSQIILSIPLAVGLFLLLPKKTALSRVTPLILFSSIALLGFLMILSPPANSDFHAFSPHSSMSFLLTEPELRTMDTVSGIWEGRITTDQYLADSQRWSGYHTRAYGEELYMGNYSSLPYDLVLVRENTVNKPFQAFMTIYHPDYDIQEELETEGFSRIYQCSAASGYVQA